LKNSGSGLEDRKSIYKSNGSAFKKSLKGMEGWTCCSLVRSIDG